MFALRCQSFRERLGAKQNVTPEDNYERGMRAMEKCILHGTTDTRTHLEVDPGIGLRGLEASGS